MQRWALPLCITHSPTAPLTCRCSPGPSSPQTHSPDKGATFPGVPVPHVKPCTGSEQRGPLGTVRPGISQLSRQLPHVDTPSALRFWKVAFLARRDSRVSVLKTRTKKFARSCFLPRCCRPCRPPAAPTRCPGRAMQPRSLRYFGVICCRGRSCLELTQIHIPCPLEAYSPGCCCTFFLRFLQRESSLSYFSQQIKLCIHSLFLLQSRSSFRDGVSPKCSFWGALRSPTLSSSSLGAMSHPAAWAGRCGARGGGDVQRHRVSPIRGTTFLEALRSAAGRGDADLS